MPSDTVRQRQKGASDTTHRDDTRGGVKKGQDTKSAGSSPLGACVRLIVKLLLIVTAGIGVALIYIFIAPDDRYPVPFSLADPPSIKVNNHLSSAEKLYEGLVHAPEQIVHHNGDIYTGTSDGRIIKISQGQISTVARLGSATDCGGYENEKKCGFPLGLKFDADGYLIVCDAYLGLLKVNIATGDVHVLLPSSVLINGRPLNFLNNLDIASDGMIYLSDSSSYSRRDFIMDLLDGRPTGRLFRYDPVRNTTEILLEDLSFANGVQLSKHEDFLLVAETFRARIIKYNLKGINAGKSEIFADNLPLFPDNIRPSSSGGFWTGSGACRFREKPFNGIDFLASRPWLRKIYTYLPMVMLFGLDTTGSMVLELNSKGEVLRFFMDNEARHVLMTSAVEDVDGVLYMGSYGQPYIAKLDSRKF